MSSVLSKRIAEEKTNRTGILTLNDEEQTRERNYNLAWSSIHLWPVQDGQDIARNVRRFREKTLLIPISKVGSLSLEHVEKIEQTRRSQIENEVLVRLQTADERDLIQSYAPNLGGKINCRNPYAHPGTPPRPVQTV